MGWFDWLVILLFFLMMIAVGWWSTSRIKNTKDYFTGAGKMPWWLSGISHHMSGYSSVVFTAYAGIAYKYGFTMYVWWAVPVSLCCFIGLFIFAPRWSRLRTHFRIQSPLEYLAVRYDIPTQQIFAWSGVLLKILDVGGKWTAFGIVLHVFTGIPFVWGVIISGSIAMFYSTVGGLWAGMVADFVQFLIQLTTGVFVLVFVMAELGGISSVFTMWERLPPEHSQLFNGPYTPLFAIGFGLVAFLGFNGGTWNLAQRYIAAPTSSDARKAALLSALLYFIWPIVLFYPMWAAPLLLPGLENPEECYSMIALKFLPAGLVGLVLASLLAQTMAMTTADATAITAVLTRDVIPLFWKKARSLSEKRAVLLARIVTLLFMCLTGVIAMFSQYFGGVFGLVIMWFSALLGPAAMGMVLGLLPWFKRCGSLAANTSLVVGAASYLVLKFLVLEPQNATNQTDALLMACPVIVSFFIYSGLGLLNVVLGIQPREESVKMLDALNLDTIPVVKKTVEKLTLEIYADRLLAGRAAGLAAAETLKKLLAEKGRARMIFAAAPSQNETLETLVAVPGIDWSKVTAFHMDEYIGLPADAPQRFSHYLKTRLFDKLPFAEVHLITGDDPNALCEEYARKLAAEPIDIVCMGVGENGHIAFNDPPVADFADPKLVKIVDLDLACRQQQVNDGCFPNLDAVPKQAVSLTIPALMSGGCLICTVPGERKRAAVHRMLQGAVSTECPASILRTHGNVTLFIDRDCWGDSDE